MMRRPRSVWLWILLPCLLITVWGCGARGTPPDPTQRSTDPDTASFWERLPRPSDAEDVEVGEGFELGFATSMIEPELFDFYASWLADQGWRQQAPTEAMVTLPRQVWRKNGTELLIEIQGLDKQGRTVVWLQLDDP